LQIFSYSLDRRKKAARAVIRLVSKIKCIFYEEYLLTPNMLILLMVPA